MIENDPAQTHIAETARLVLRELTLEDASFILELVNEPAFIRFIGDRGIRNLERAQEYLIKGPLASYQRTGFGLWLVLLKNSGEPVGICGLIKRDSLPDVDIGYAYLERTWGNGYAREAAEAVMGLAFGRYSLKRLVAVTDLDNARSMHLLESIGFRYEKNVRLIEDGPPLNLFASEV